MRSRGRLGHAVPSLSYDSLVLRQSGLGPLQYMDGWVPYSKYKFLLSSSVSPTVQMTGPPTVNTYAPVFLLWIPHSTQMSGSPTVKYTCFYFSRLCTDDWVPCSKYTRSYLLVNIQMFLFLRQSRLGPLQYTDDWVPCGQYTDVPISEGSASGTLQRRCLHVVFRRSAIPRPRWT